MFLIGPGRKATVSSLSFLKMSSVCIQTNAELFLTLPCKFHCYFALTHRHWYVCIVSMFSLWQEVLKAPSGFTFVLGQWPKVETCFVAPHIGAQHFIGLPGCLFIIDTFLSFQSLNPLMHISVDHAHIAELCYHTTVYIYCWNTFRSKKIWIHYAVHLNYNLLMEQPSRKLILCTNHWWQRIYAGAYRLQIVWLTVLQVSVAEFSQHKWHFCLIRIYISHFLTMY
jgi:hypothetical protein